MENIVIEKKQLRKKVFELGKSYTEKELAAKSEKIMNILERSDIFQKAKTIFIYHNLKGEVETTCFINKWFSQKDFYLPVIVDDKIVFRKYISDDLLLQSEYGIQEPTGKDFTNNDNIDLIIVPGVAFDHQMNRMGRGKGYYDRFLSNLKSKTKIGICFDFQFFDQIPTNENDIKMDYIITEMEMRGQNCNK